MNWRRKWQHTPVFLPGESQGQRSLVGCYLWGRIESDTTEVTSQQQQQVVKNLPSNVGDRRDTGSILGLERLPWRRAWQPTPVFLCGKSHGRRSLEGCRLSTRHRSTKTHFVNFLSSVQTSGPIVYHDFFMIIRVNYSYQVGSKTCPGHTRKPTREQRKTGSGG